MARSALVVARCTCVFPRLALELAAAPVWLEVVSRHVQPPASASQVAEPLHESPIWPRRGRPIQFLKGAPSTGRVCPPPACARACLFWFQCRSTRIAEQGACSVASARKVRAACNRGCSSALCIRPPGIWLELLAPHPSAAVGGNRLVFGSRSIALRR